MGCSSMRKYENGRYVDLTSEEIAERKAMAEQAEAEYWAAIDYAEAVNAKIREKYTISQEFAILRQMLKKPAEFAEYFAYCEECKAFVKKKKGLT